MGVSDEREARAPEGISKPPSEGISEKVSDVILGIASDGTAASALGGIDKALGAAGAVSDCAGAHSGVFHSKSSRARFKTISISFSSSE